MSALPDDDELQAAELAFGLLDGADRSAAQARLTGDADFAAAHARWQDHAAAMFGTAGEPPRPSIWGAIEARLPANDAATGGRAALRWWQAGTLVASAAALVLAIVVVEHPVRPNPPAIRTAPAAPLVALLTGKDQGIVAVSYDRASGRLTLTPNGIEIGAHSPELWVIPADGKPRSLGVIASGTPGWRRAPAPAAATIAPGVTLAISVEPLGGSSTGQPTGPVILTGKVSTT